MNKLKTIVRNLHYWTYQFL